MTKTSVSTTLRDDNRRIDYVVISYRPISAAELKQVVAYFLASPEGRNVKPGKRYKIETSIGLV